MSATASCMAALPRKAPGRVGISNELIAGVTTMLLVCPAIWAASAAKATASLSSPCWSQTTPLAETWPSAWVGKYQSADVTEPLGPNGMASAELPVFTPVTPLLSGGLTYPVTSLWPVLTAGPGSNPVSPPMAARSAPRLHSPADHMFATGLGSGIAAAGPSRIA